MGADPPSTAPPQTSTSVRMPLLALVAVHLVLCTTPLLAAFIPGSPWMLPLVWTTAVPGLGALMTLSFWLGMGGGGLVFRFVGAVVGVGYIAVWSALGSWLPQRPAAWTMASMFEQFAAQVGMPALIVGTFGLGFLIARRWWSLQWQAAPRDVRRHGWRQYSLLSMLVLITVIALVLMFVRFSRAEGNRSPDTWRWVVISVVGCGIYFVNTVLAAHAALGSRPLVPRILAALVIAALLGVAMSFAARHDQFAWWFVASFSFSMALPTLIVIGSLLVVRRYGYRLVAVRASSKSDPPPLTG
jgi:MFS family permease